MPSFPGGVVVIVVVVVVVVVVVIVVAVVAHVGIWSDSETRRPHSSPRCLEVAVVRNSIVICYKYDGWMDGWMDR